MDPQDLNYLLNKYSRTPTSGRTEEYFTNYSPGSSLLPFHDTNTKAYNTAVSALQERIRFLEDENSNLYERYQLSGAKLQDERRLSEKLSKDLHAVSSTEQFNNISNTELKQQLFRANKEILDLQMLLKLSNNHHLTGLQQENFNLKTELDRVLREVAAKKDNEISLIAELRKMEEAKYLVQKELTKEKWRAQEMQDENRELKEVFEKFNHKEQAESELKHQNEQFVRTIKGLESRCRCLEEACQPALPISKLSQVQSTQSKTRQKSPSFLKKRSNSKISKSTTLTSQRTSILQNSHVGGHLMDPSNFTKKIYRMESEIVDLNNKYLKLLHASKSETNSPGKKQADINNLATDLEDKGNPLSTPKISQRNLDLPKKTPLP